MPDKSTTASYSHLSFEDRQTIEERIGRESIRSIAKRIGVDPSTVSREVCRNRVRDKSRRYGEGTTRFCAVARHCEIRGLCKSCSTRLCRVCKKCLCTHRCPHYVKARCERLVGAPHVCNGCGKKTTCVVERWIYDARAADSRARLRLCEERSGFDLTADEIKSAADLIVPLIKAGQSIGQIYLNHSDEISFSQRSLRTYIHAGVFAELTDFDLKRKVRYKVRSKRVDKPARHIPDRSYSDFALLDSDMQARATEIDTVIGRVGGKCLLTLYMRNCALMPIFLLDSCDGDCVSEAFAVLEGSINGSADDIGFFDLFPVLLADRGSEFSDYYSLELFGPGKEQDQWTRLYYCDPRHPEQRAGQEKNHTYIREYLPKGSSFDHLSQNEVDLMASHINAIPRQSLGGKSPYELASFLYGSDWLDLLGITHIAADDVVRNNSIFKRSVDEEK